MKWIKIEKDQWFGASLRWILSPVERSILIDLAASSEYGELRFTSLNALSKRFSVEEGCLKEAVSKLKDLGFIEEKEEGFFLIKVDSFFPKVKKTQPLPKIQGEVVITIPIINSKDEYPIYSSMVEEFQRLYPAVDVLQELKKIRAWNISNPLYRKTERGILRHINQWLSRAQDSKGPKQEVKRESLSGLKIWYKWSKKDEARREREVPYGNGKTGGNFSNEPDP